MWRENFGKVGVVVVFGGGWPVPAVKNSPFRRYLSKNGPYPVSHFALGGGGAAAAAAAAASILINFSDF